MARLWTYKEGLATALDGQTVIVNPPPPPPPPNDKVWWVGLSRATQGLNQSQAGKQSDTLQRIGQFAAATGVTAAAMRAKTMWHGYVSGTNWVPSSNGFFDFVASNGLLGLMINQGIPDYPTWGSGGYDTNFLNYLKGISAIRTPDGRKIKCVVIFQHEPENDANAVADSPNWRKGTARFMKITADYNDPDILYSTCHIPGSMSTNWNPRTELNTLAGSVAAGQAIMNRTLCGLDPYPEVDNNGTTLQTLEGRCRAAINMAKSWGYTRFSMPEVGLFNYLANGSGPGPLNAVGQAKRVKDELWTWAKANGFESFCYFDVTDVSNPRGDSRTLETPEEQAVYGHIILNQTP